MQTVNDRLQEIVRKLYQLATETRCPPRELMDKWGIDTGKELMDVLADDVGYLANKLEEVIDDMNDGYNFDQQLTNGGEHFPEKSKQQEFFETDSIGEKHEDK